MSDINASCPIEAYTVPTNVINMTLYSIPFCYTSESCCVRLGSVNSDRIRLTQELLHRNLFPVEYDVIWNV